MTSQKSINVFSKYEKIIIYHYIYSSKGNSDNYHGNSKIIMANGGNGYHSVQKEHDAFWRLHLVFMASIVWIQLNEPYDFIISGTMSHHQNIGRDRTRPQHVHHPSRLFPKSSCVMIIFRNLLVVNLFMCPAHRDRLNFMNFTMSRLL